MSRFSEIASDNFCSFEMLVHEYHEPLRAFSYRITNNWDVSEDLVQDVFVSIWCKRKNINFGEMFGGYLYTMIRNASLNYVRDTKKYPSAVVNAIPSNEMADLFMIEEEFNRLLTISLKKLPPRTAEVIKLTMQGLSQADIAEIMSVTVSNVKNLKASGLKKLKEMLGPYWVLFIIRILAS